MSDNGRRPELEHATSALVLPLQLLERGFELEGERAAMVLATLALGEARIGRELGAADGGDQPGYERVIGAAEPDDDVGQAAEGFAAAVGDGPFEQRGQARLRLAAGRGTRSGGRGGRHGKAS